MSVKKKIYFGFQDCLHLTLDMHEETSYNILIDEERLGEKSQKRISDGLCCYGNIVIPFTDFLYLLFLDFT